jgi:hypothetical protein
MISAEMYFMRTTGYDLSGCKRNEGIMTELQSLQIREFTEQYRRNCKEHTDRILVKILKYHPNEEAWEDLLSNRWIAFCNFPDRSQYA